MENTIVEAELALFKVVDAYNKLTTKPIDIPKEFLELMTFLEEFNYLYDIQDVFIKKEKQGIIPFNII